MSIDRDERTIDQIRNCSKVNVHDGKSNETNKFLFFTYTAETVIRKRCYLFTYCLIRIHVFHELKRYEMNKNGKFTYCKSRANGNFKVQIKPDNSIFCAKIPSMHRFYHSIDLMLFMSFCVVLENFFLNRNILKCCKIKMKCAHLFDSHSLLYFHIEEKNEGRKTFRHFFG